MSKVNLKSILENKSTNDKKIYSLIGIKKDNKINYLEENMNVSIVFDKDVKIKRKDETKEITLEFVNKKYSKCQYKAYGNVYELDVYTNDIIITDDYIEIDYNIEEDNINFKLYIK